MGIIADVLKGMKQLLLMEERVTTTHRANLRLSNMVADMDRRLIRIETYLELTSRNDGQAFTPPAIEHK